MMTWMNENLQKYPNALLASCCCLACKIQINKVGEKDCAKLFWHYLKLDFPLIPTCSLCLMCFFFNVWNSIHAFAHFRSCLFYLELVCSNWNRPTKRKSHCLQNVCTGRCGGKSWSEVLICTLGGDRICGAYAVIINTIIQAFINIWVYFCLFFCGAWLSLEPAVINHPSNLHIPDRPVLAAPPLRRAS